MNTSIQGNTASITSTKSQGRLVEFRNLAKTFSSENGNIEVLKNVNLTVQAGEFICVIGHSGCGKSTLLNTLSGFEKPSSGEVLVGGEAVESPGPDRMVVFQNYALLPWKTALNNVALGLYATRETEQKKELLKEAQEMLETVGLGDAFNRHPGELSGGMRQRVAIARAMAIKTPVLIMDEPFGALDPITKEELQEELLALWRQQRCTVLMITHDIDEALFLADRVVMLTNGPAATIGEILEIPFSRPRNRESLLHDDRYGKLRNRALDFLYEGVNLIKS
ncbi:ABC transporter ATP-binding protein [Synechococcus sp. Cruz CV12-2-Slac-r]|uniref:ABC transporter ATP-binding protein n=1 Tax=Synechococcus sp. Cruz CV12-2-Slac-r TaxID=2823748 RepID=UPI0028F44BC9|nr:ABC transporter ATP-binding protein [Synechococcus sp. Cruz CV12-2-Slac-r]MCP9940200.1 ABC transporter ATP-binding protein [Synechococcus sp. Cruz CV12-2-Slac-r]